MTVRQRSQSGTNLLQTALAKPYHYRRSGRYYLRLRPQGNASGFYTLSLRTTDKATAMTISKDILKALAAFHLDNPSATWDELRERLVGIAENCLTMAHGDDSLVAYEMIYDELRFSLREASAKGSMTVDQQRAASKAEDILVAAQERMKGRSGALVDLIRELNGEPYASMSSSPSPSVSVSEPITFKDLSGLYMAERKNNVQASTMRDIRSSCESLGAVLGELNLKAHKREDMIALKEKLLENHAGSTVNKMLTRLSTVMDWAVNNGYLDKSYDKGLKLTKGADSSREALSQAQVRALMTHANGLPVDDWTRWALSLGAITGARIGEILQITAADIREVSGHWVIDINTEGEKTVKTKNSRRMIPLVAAYGFDVETFRAFVVETIPTGRVFGLSAGRFSEVLNGALRAVLSIEADRKQTFHSLRHSLAGALKAAAVDVGTAEAILGHSSGSISYDLYGAGSAVQVHRIAEALKVALAQGLDNLTRARNFMGIELDVLVGRSEHDLLFIATQLARAAGLEDGKQAIAQTTNRTVKP